VTLGTTLNLTANGVADADGSVDRVEFYFDTNNDGDLDIGTDVLLGQDDSASGGYRLAVDTDDPAFGLDVGMNRFIARVVDNDGDQNSGTTAVVIRFNSAPTIGSIEVTPDPILRTASFTVTLTDVEDDGGVNLVQIFRDSNGNGVFDSADILVGNATRVGTTSSWIFTTSGSRLPAGTYNLFARARDTNNVFGNPISAMVTVM
jgi:hypothetical protein